MRITIELTGTEAPSTTILTPATGAEAVSGAATDGGPPREALLLALGGAPAVAAQPGGARPGAAADLDAGHAPVSVAEFIRSLGRPSG